MKSNKIFLLSAITLALALFAGLTYWSRPSTIEDKEARTAIVQHLIKPHSPIKGAKDAKVTVVEFLDPECEACRAMHPIINRLLSEYEGKVRVVIRYMPFHGNSLLAAAALEEARELGKYDEALDKLFEKQPEWADHRNPRPELITVLLRELGIEEKLLGSSYLISKHRWKIDLDYADGIKVDVKRTPTFFVNGKMLSEIGYEPVKRSIEESLKNDRH